MSMLFDQRLEGRRRVPRLACERIQVDDDEVDEADAVALERGQVVGTDRGAPGCRRGCSGCSVLTRPSIISGKAGQRRRRWSRAGRRRLSARAVPAGRDELEAACDEAAREIDDSGLVGDTQQGSWHMRESPVLSLRRRAGLAP